VNPAAESLGLRDFYHVGIVVRNIDDAMQDLEGRFGVGRWATMAAEFPGSYRGSEVTAGAKIAYAPSGIGYVELVEPTSGTWAAQAFLDEHGEGVYHLGYWVDDIVATLRRAGELGLGVDTVGTDPQGPVFAYLEPAFGVHIELVRASVRPMLESWVAGVQ
jgi:catechol 2,3-dioxygenase-like lactoylglutathione lyase family enzyme